MSARRRTALALTTAAVTIPLLVGCGALDKALDCVKTADAIAQSVDNLRQAVSDIAENPLQAEQALDRIDEELDSLKDRTDDADLGKAVDDLTDGVDKVRTDIKNGDETPDITPITDAAAEIGKICTP
ncbi:hypothetical protein GCM10020367_24990 [Streptomyces sannanensis]|uniref:Secreted protein n=1 Tax=Streptomyces sannanensis TaxID=285536 RepID=A0ABP6SA69_9ACTN